MDVKQTSLSQSLYFFPPGPTHLFGSNPSFLPLLPYAFDSHLPPTPLQSVLGLPGPSHGPPCWPPLLFQLHSPCLHWSRLSLSPAGPLPSIIGPPDQCELNIRYPLHTLYSPCPMLTTHPPTPPPPPHPTPPTHPPHPPPPPPPLFAYHIVPRLLWPIDGLIHVRHRPLIP